MLLERLVKNNIWLHSQNYEDERDWELMNMKIWETVWSADQNTIHNSSKYLDISTRSTSPYSSSSGYITSSARGSRKSSCSTVPKRLHVSNIPFKYRDVDLRHLFRDFGEILNAEVIFNKRGPMGYGFITFADSVEADKALKEINGLEIGGRVIQVNSATPKCKKRSQKILKLEL